MKGIQPEMKKPRRLVHVGALKSNVETSEVNNVMSKNITATAEVIPFCFESHEVRSMLIDGQPWFVAADVCQALAVRNNRDALSRLDEDEKGVATTDTLGGTQAAGIINESGLYSLILTSRKPEAKRFKKWVTAEVLPAIRKYGRYIDENGQMDSLVGAVIGTSGVLVLDRVIEQKASPIPQGMRRSFKHTMKSRLRNRFNVQRADLIPAEQLADACNFIAAYAIEGEWLPKKEKPNQQLDIHFPVDYLSGRRPGMLHPRNESTDYLNVSLLDLIEPFDSPCEAILSRLGKAGYNVDGAWWEIRTYRNKIGQLRSLLENFRCNFEGAQQYVIKRGIAA